MPATAAELYADETAGGALGAAARSLPASSIDARPYELEAGRHVPPDRVWASWLCGDHLVAERREVLRQFANGIDADSRRVHRAFLSSVRVLGEGVDIVGSRGVEAICFADTRGSQVEIVQNIGRALRPNPDGTQKNSPHHRASLPLPRRRPAGHGRLRQLPSPCCRPPRPAQPR
ncbi:hypothetical protein [Streptomyces sp. CA-132043]|uniref:hypothetical protein n=1 Tax=Streptomyces sp. CA-132043 TaxID=3240048 RepID=UPI003D8ECE7E